MNETRKLIDAELARVEAVIFDAENSKKKKHLPTIDIHRGERIAYKKALSWMELEENFPCQPSNLVIDYVYSLEVPVTRLCVSSIIFALLLFFSLL
jgi:hypothetical protein